jgi:hypothetical protein
MNNHKPEQRGGGTVDMEPMDDRFDEIEITELDSRLDMAVDPLLMIPEFAGNNCHNPGCNGNPCGSQCTNEGCC